MHAESVKRMFYSQHVAHTDETFSYEELLTGTPHISTTVSDIFSFYTILPPPEQGMGDSMHTPAQHTPHRHDTSFVSDPPAAVGPSLGLLDSAPTSTTTTITTTSTTTEMGVDTWSTLDEGQHPPQPTAISPPASLPFDQSPSEWTADPDLDWSLDFYYITPQDDGAAAHYNHNAPNFNHIHSTHSTPYDAKRDDRLMAMPLPPALDIPDDSSMLVDKAHGRPHLHPNGRNKRTNGNNHYDRSGEHRSKKPSVASRRHNKRQTKEANYPDTGENGEDDEDDEDYEEEVVEATGGTNRPKRAVPRAVLPSHIPMRGEDGDTQSHPNGRVGFSQVPLVVFDTATIPVWKVMTGYPPAEDSPPLENSVAIYPVYDGHDDQSVTGPRQIFQSLDDEFKFPHKFADQLSDTKKVVLHLEGMHFTIAAFSILFLNVLFLC